MEEALQWVKTFVDQCRTGRSAELRLNCEGGQLRVNVSADLGSLRATTVPQGGWDWGLQKVRPSQWRRRNRRAAERAAAEEAALNVSAKNAVATEKDTEEKADAEKAAEKKDAAEKAADAKKASESEVAAEKVVELKAATKKDAEVKDLAEKAAEEVSVATTSCVHSKVQCLNCNGSMTPDHQCELPKSEVVEHPPPLPLCPVKPTQSAVAGSIPPRSMVEVSKTVEESEVAEVNLPPLPLCHYCCHLGSGDNPVHYFLQCLCADKVCNCQCYCSDVQLMHKKKFFPGGFAGSLSPVSPGDRPRAKAIAEARANKLDFRGVPMASRPCDNENCL